MLNLFFCLFSCLPVWAGASYVNTSRCVFKHTCAYVFTCIGLFSLFHLFSHLLIHLLIYSLIPWWSCLCPCVCLLQKSIKISGEKEGVCVWLYVHACHFAVPSGQKHPSIQWLSQVRLASGLEQVSVQGLPHSLYSILSGHDFPVKTAPLHIHLTYITFQITVYSLGLHKWDFTSLHVMNNTVKSVFKYTKHISYVFCK